MAVVTQEDWSAGIYRGREVPRDSAYDLLNVLLDDTGQPFRRGGSAYKSNADAGATLTGIVDAQLYAGQRTVFWANGQSLILSGDDATPAAIPASTWADLARAAMLRGVAFFRKAASVDAYAGSRKSSYSTGTMTLTNGSKTVTGVGTAFLANVDKGMIIYSVLGLAVVESVQTDTSLTLRDPWPGATGGVATLIEGVHANAYSGSAVTAVGSAGRRLLIADNTNRVFYSAIDNGFSFSTNNYHELPEGPGTAIEDLGGVAVVFTAGGVYAISGLIYDALDDAGNVQHEVDPISDLRLLGDGGLAKWRDVLVAPCTEDVWLIPGEGEPVPISDGIRSLYRGYVASGYAPGLATVFRGHYVLPIVNGTTLIDVLVCRLDRGFAWTRWAGHGASIAYAMRMGATTRTPKLFGVAAQRVTELTDAWAPSVSNASEGDSSVHSIRIETRDLATPGGGRGSTTRKVKVRYEAAAASPPSFAMSYARGLEGAAYTSLGDAIRGGAASDGLDESVWPVARQAPSIRFRLESSSALSSFKLRSIAAEYTPRGM